LSVFLATSISQVVVYVDASEADEFLEVVSKPLRSLPYDSPGQTFVAFEKPEGDLATSKFSNILRFIVKEVCVCSNCCTFCCFSLSAVSFWSILCAGLVS
jgi:hypothetical protein